MLPPELIDLTIDELGSQICDVDTLTALQQCTRTSRSLRDRARRYIFANITVIEQRDCRDTYQKLNKMRRILDGDPNIVNYFQEFTILLNTEGYLASNESGFAHVLNIIKTTLGRNGLNKLTICTDSGDAIIWPAGDDHYDFNQAFCTICEECIPKKVEIYAFRDIPLHILAHTLKIQSFSTTSTFTDVAVTYSNMVDLFTTHPLANISLSPCKWRTLEISKFFNKLCPAIANIVSKKEGPVFGNLEHLWARLFQRSDRLALDLVLMSANNTLRTLECVISHPWLGSNDIVRTIDMGSMSFPKLQTLHLQLYDVPHLRKLGYCNTIGENILILRPETLPFKYLSKLEITLNIHCDTQEDLDDTASYDEGWTFLDAFIAGDLWQALRNVHFEIKVGTFMKPMSYRKTFNFDAFSNFLETSLPRASNSKTLSLTMTIISLDQETQHDNWMCPVSIGYL